MFVAGRPGSGHVPKGGRYLLHLPHVHGHSELARALCVGSSQLGASAASSRRGHGGGSSQSALLGSGRSPRDRASRQHAEQSIRAFCDPQAGERTTATPAGPHQMPKELPVALPQPPPPEIRSEIRPEHELVDSPDGNDVLVLRVKLPELEGLADAQVPASPQPPTTHLTSPPHPCLEPSSPNKSPDLE